MNSKSNKKYFIGIDVGTGSARAGVFDSSGTCLGVGKKTTTLYRDTGHIVEQSSDDIWSAVCHSVKDAVKAADIDVKHVVGIGFDATCSLVVIGADNKPMPVGSSGDSKRNIMVWMDHRAAEQATRINATKHRVLDYVGGVISPEMETPKLLWLKENQSDIFNNAKHFFDLTDFLTWKASDDLARSVCTVSCKWTYMAHEQSWDKSYFDEIGLSELSDNNFERIGSKIVDAGTSLGDGLTKVAAKELGLLKGIPVAAGLIDAHAGGVGTIGAASGDGSPTSRMAYVFGTSACTMSSSEKEAFVPGVWGPYFSAMVPGLWLSEGGQSAAGEAIAHLLKLHPSYASASIEAKYMGYTLPDYLLHLIDKKDLAPSDVVSLAKQLVVVPEFLGNRAPFADPNARAIISGLSLNTSVDSLVGLYVAGIVGLGYGLRQILNVQAENGVTPDTVVMSGGAGENSLVRQLIADSANIIVTGPGSEEPVLLGAAMLGAVAGNAHPTLKDAMSTMSSLGDVFTPSKGSVSELHTRRFEAFEALQAASKLIHEE
ncbi:MAG: FGGY-family carbohydrate kinase [Rhodothermales bacterium]